MYTFDEKGLYLFLALYEMNKRKLKLRARHNISIKTLKEKAQKKTVEQYKKIYLEAQR